MNLDATHSGSKLWRRWSTFVGVEAGLNNNRAKKSVPLCECQLWRVISDVLECAFATSPTTQESLLKLQLSGDCFKIATLKHHINYGMVLWYGKENFFI